MLTTNRDAAIGLAIDSLPHAERLLLHIARAALVFMHQTLARLQHRLQLIKVTIKIGVAIEIHHRLLRRHLGDVLQHHYLHPPEEVVPSAPRLDLIRSDRNDCHLWQRCIDRRGIGDHIKRIAGGSLCQKGADGEPYLHVNHGVTTYHEVNNIHINRMFAAKIIISLRNKKKNDYFFSFLSHIS